MHVPERAVTGKVRALLFFLCVVPTTPLHAESYICVANSPAAGFAYNKDLKQWTATTFKTSNKFIIKRPDESSLDDNYYRRHKGQISWVVQPIGKGLSAWCNEDFSEYGLLNCRGYGAQIKFDSQSKRYVLFYIGDFNDENDALALGESPDTPFVELGECTKKE